MSKYIFIAILDLSIIFFLSCENNQKNGINNEIKNDSSVILDDTISLIFVGDIMMGSTFPSNDLPPDDGKYLFKDVSEILKDADLTVGNLEGPLLDKGGSPKICDGCVAFRTPTRYAKYLKEAGFDFVNLANNHSNDMGLEGRISTKTTLDSFGIGYFGLRENPFSNIVLKNRNIIFTGFARNHYLNDVEKALNIIEEINNDTSIIAVSIHAGAEGESAVNVTKKREFYMNEDRGNIYEFAHKMVDSGADIVFCHGPHVPRGIELYNGKIIAYSLGNFCTYGKFGLTGNLGLAPILKIYINKNGEFLHGRIFSCKQIKRGIPVLDKSNAAIKLIRKLSTQNFSESQLLITDDGSININGTD